MDSARCLWFTNQKEFGNAPLLSKNLVYKWKNRHVFGALEISIKLRVLGSHRQSTLEIFTTAINTTSLCGNITCCTVAFSSGSNISILIGNQIVYHLTLADYWVPIQFKVEHMRVCDAAWWSQGDKVIVGAKEIVGSVLIVWWGVIWKKYITISHPSLDTAWFLDNA